MLLQFQDHLQQEFAFLEGKQLFLAVSGGVDSMVLLHLMHQLPYKIAVLHCNFSLRGAESDGDTAFVQDFCARHNIPCFVKVFDTACYAEQHKLSIQVAARQLRYDWFSEQLQAQGYDYLLTAHHLEDSLETFLINFTRGTGIDGLMGIPKQNERVIRPLLPFSRQEVMDYASLQQLQWREDSSNASDKYLRNKLRHEVVPVLKSLNPSFLDSFQATLNHLQQVQSLAVDALDAMYAKVVHEEGNQLKINIEVLLKVPNYKAYLFAWLKEYGFTAWEDLYELLTAQSGKKVLSKDYGLLKDRDFLILYPKEQQDLETSYSIAKEQEVVKVPLKLTFNREEVNINQTTNCIFVDEDRLDFPLTLRKWEEGDVFYPLGMQGKKKLSKYFKDEKMSLIDKSAQWLLCTGNKIVWVIGKRQDERFKTTLKTTNKLQITLEL